ncbi:MAG TPA: pyridoxamine 5'-phosphate oxidase family protein [Acidimicrobiia bacterium]
MLSAPQGPLGPGDLGRRIAHRRRGLGLSREQLARRSGMSVGYLKALEQRPTQPTTLAVLRLAAALDTTAGALLGMDADRTSSHGPGDARPLLEELGPEEARRLLGGESVGRVVLDTDDRGPVAIPVNYRVLDGAIVLRTAASSTLARAAGNRVGFEVDHLDAAFARGWSVLVTGRLEGVTDPGVARELTAHGARPWAGGDRPVVLRIDPTAMTGRRISPRW